MSTVTTTGASVAVVEVRAPGQAPERLAVTGALVLGRGDGVHRLPDTRVSRRHLLLSTVSGRLVVTDLGSSNGTRVNGTLLRGSRTVRPGDVIDVGDSRIEVVEVPGDAGAGVDDRTTTRARPGLGSAAVAAGPTGRRAVLRLPDGTQRPLDLGPVTDLGRDHVDVVVDDPTVSRRHLRLTLTPGGTVAADLGSRNGTTLDGVRLTGPTVVPPGAHLGFGDTVLVLLDDAMPPGDVSVPPLPPVTNPAPAPAPAGPAPATVALGLSAVRRPDPFAPYVQQRSRVPEVVWHAVRAVSVATYLAVCALLVARPADGLFVFWNLVVPVLPLVFFVAPGAWRNVCPLAAGNQMSRLLQVTRGLPAPQWLVDHGFALSAGAFVTIVASRKVLFNGNGPALAALLLATLLAASAGGFLLKGKSGWCSSVCPLLPLQRLYGQTPFVLVPNSHCRPCVGCTKNCYDFNPRAAYPSDLRDPDPAWSAPRKLFAGAFPGLVVGYFTIPAPPAIGVAEMYGRFGLHMLAGAGALFALDAILRRRTGAVVAAFAATGFGLFYGFAAVPVAATVERLTGVDVAAAVWPVRAGGGVLAALWWWRTTRLERAFVARSAPAPAASTSAATTSAGAAAAGVVAGVVAEVTARPQVRFSPQDRRVAVEPGRTLLEVAEADGLPIEAGCRMGVCGADPVAVLEGADALSPVGPDEAATLARLGYAGATRLACCAQVRGDCVVSLTPDVAADDAPERTGSTTGSSPAPDADPTVRRVVVVGQGVAGVTAADVVRRRLPDCEIHLVGAEEHPLYNRMAITRLIHGRSAMQGLYLQPESWAQRRRITSWLNTRVRELDVAGHAVVLATGERLEYDRLVLASGSAAAVPAIEGFGMPGTFVLRRAADAIDVRAYAQQHGARRAVVAGAGLLGLEAAYALHQLGLAVTVLERSPRLLRRAVDAECSALLAGYLEELGIEVLTEAEAVGVSAGPAAPGFSPGISGVTLGDGRSPAADLLVVCAGIVPEAKLAREAGVTVRRGVVVDDRMRTSAADVYAAGDVVEHAGQVPGLWPVAVEQATVAASNATGADLRYAPSPTPLVLKGVGIDLTALPAPAAPAPTGPDDEPVVVAGPGRFQYVRLEVRGGALAGAVVLGRSADAPVLLDAVRRRTPVGPLREALAAGSFEVLAGS